AENAAKDSEKTPEQQIDDAIAELETKLEPAADDEEESHTIPVEHMDDEEGPVSDPDYRPQSVLDNAYKIEALRA
ncbi:hypothetical protein H1215_12525, partial [Anoxybacillus sp. LAT_38]